MDNSSREFDLVMPAHLKFRLVPSLPPQATLMNTCNLVCALLKN
jgi:hypothetical protein